MSGRDDPTDLLRALAAEADGVSTAAPEGFRFTDLLGCGVASPRVVYLPDDHPTDPASLRRAGAKAMRDYRSARLLVPSDDSAGVAEWEQQVAAGVPRYREDGSIERVSLAKFQSDLVPPSDRPKSPPKDRTADGYDPQSAVYRRPLARGR